MNGVTYLKRIEQLVNMSKVQVMRLKSWLAREKANVRAMNVTEVEIGFDGVGMSSDATQNPNEGVSTQICRKK